MHALGHLVMVVFVTVPNHDPDLSCSGTIFILGQESEQNTHSNILSVTKLIVVFVSRLSK